MPSIAIEASLVLDEWLDPRGEYLLVDPRGRILRAAYGRPPSWTTPRRLDGYLFPSFVDAHMHLSWLGLALSGADLRGSRSPREVAERLARAPGPIAYGRGWDQEEFEDPETLPDRRLLDAAVPDRPAVAVRVCGHVAVANTRALEKARPWEKYPELVDRERGILREDAVYHTVEALLSRLSIDALVAEAARAMASVGVGAVASMSCPLGEARALSSGAGQPLLVACYPPPEALEEALRLEGTGFEVAGVKLFADGTLGARTAWLRSGYSDDPGNRGMLLLDPGELRKIAGRVLSAGLRVAVHAIGDAALDAVLDALEPLDPGGQVRIEHASIAWDDQIERIASLGVQVVAQPRFRVSDWWIDRRLGERVRLAYRLRSLHKAALLALSTDAPVEPIEPWETLAAATGQCSQPACTPRESLSWREAFHAYTRNSALAAWGPAALLGTLEPGAPASVSWTPSDPRDSGWRGPARLLLQGARLLPVS